LQGQTVWQPGYGLFSNNGVVTNRPFNATDLAGIMAALTNSNTTGLANNSNNGPKPTTLLNTQSLNQLISDANATEIQAQVDEQLANQKNGQPTTNLSQGYAAGIFQQIEGPEEDFQIGTLSNLSPSEVSLLFDGPGGTFSGASFSLFVNGGELGEGGAKIVFSPLDLQTAFPEEIPDDIAQQLSDLGLFFGGASGAVENAIIVYQNTVPGSNGPVLTDPALLNPESSAVLVGVSGNGQVFCESCSFLKWGAWEADLGFQNDSESEPNHVGAVGWFVSGDLPTIGQLPTQGEATYAGTALGTAAIQNCEGGWQTSLASGNVNMSWNFAERSGTLAISNFTDHTNPYTPLPTLNVSGTMNMPGQLSEINKFSGPLLPTPDSGTPSSITGNAVGSFAANGSDKAAGVIGNFNAGNENYRASGIFGAGHATLPSLNTNNLGPGN
jgi:hypothetical protein